MSAALAQPGALVGGRYRVERILGSGATGLVVAASDEGAGGRAVALKLMVAASPVSAAVQARFLREARAAGALRSPHTVRILDVGTLDEDGTPFLVMERLEGEDLGALLRRRGRLPVAEAVGHMREAAEALAEAHALRIVHRDIKPANLFLARGPGGATAIKVLDFGICKLGPAGTDPSTLNTTGGGVVLGSPHYMAPEQLRAPGEVDARADVWALGITLHELLEGQPPFLGQSVIDLSVKVLHDRPAAPGPQVPPALAAVIARALAKDPAQRFADAGAFGRALADADRVARAPAAGPRRRAPWILLALAVVGSVVALGSLRWRRQPPAPADPPALVGPAPTAAPAWPDPGAPPAPATIARGPAPPAIDEAPRSPAARADPAAPVRRPAATAPSPPAPAQVNRRRVRRGATAPRVARVPPPPPVEPAPPDLPSVPTPPIDVYRDRR